MLSSYHMRHTSGRIYYGLDLHRRLAPIWPRSPRLSSGCDWWIQRPRWAVRGGQDSDQVQTSALLAFLMLCYPAATQRNSSSSAAERGSDLVHNGITNMYTERVRANVAQIRDAAREEEERHARRRGMMKM